MTIEKVEIGGTPFMRPYEVEFGNVQLHITNKPYDKDVTYDEKTTTKLHVPTVIDKVPTKENYDENIDEDEDFLKRRLETKDRLWVLNSTTRNYLIEKLGNNEESWIGKIVEVEVRKIRKRKAIYATGST